MYRGLHHHRHDQETPASKKAAKEGSHVALLVPYAKRASTILQSAKRGRYSADRSPLLFSSRERHSRVSQCETEAFRKSMPTSKACRLRFSSMWSPVSGLLFLLLFALGNDTISVFQFPFEIGNDTVSVFQFLLKISDDLILLLILIQQKGNFLLLCTLHPWRPSRAKRLLGS